MAALAAVIPLQGKDIPTDSLFVPGPGELPLPEPAQLYCLVVIALCPHTPRDGACVRCPEPWPCEHLRLAYRLREAF